MNGLLKYLVVFLAATLAAFALPSNAATGTKYFWAEFDQNIGSGNKVNVIFNNATPPPGVSTINSVRVKMAVAPAGITITQVRMVAQNGVPITPIVVSFATYGSAATGTDIVINNFPGIKNNKSGTFELTLGGTLPTTCTGITWQAFANTGNAYPGGDEFQQSEVVPSKLLTGIGCDGILYCENTSGNQYDFGNSSTGGKRGGYNKDGSPCIPVLYDFRNNIDSSDLALRNSVRLIWDTNSQKNAAFEIWIDWQPELVANDGLPSKTTRVAWTFDTNGDPIKQIGRACTSDSLPQPYGTLTAYNSTNSTITIGPAGSALSIPTVFPFAISIGDGTTTERLHVTSSPSAGVYVVVREQGGTTAINLTSVVGTALVMSNPLPLDQSTPTPLQMQMCIAEETWQSLPAGSCSPNPDGRACLKYRSRVFDIGDGFVNRDL